ncbi:MAG: hypothetical protein IKX31_03955 [Muribaculaceae bacterium]|nr:hypothetical protein [Muribaculaceae bacterium]
MEINIQYLIALLVTWILTGWLVLLEKDNVSSSFWGMTHYVDIMDSCLWQLLKIIPVLAVIISLVINGIMIDWIQSLCYLGILVGAIFVNWIIYGLYTNVLGTDGIAVFIPVILVPLSVIYLFIAQFVLPVISYTIK